MNANGGDRSTVHLNTRWVPTDIVLEPRESINSTCFSLGVTDVRELIKDNFQSLVRRYGHSSCGVTGGQGYPGSR